ncbi:hypothetical protein ACOSP7_024489 [Xanthoceras sorbifolium]
MADWADLHDHLLTEIVRRIKYYEDFVSFCCVCSSWKSAAVIDNFQYKSSQIPWLMLPPTKGTNRFDFFCLPKANHSSDHVARNLRQEVFYFQGFDYDSR